MNSIIILRRANCLVDVLRFGQLCVNLFLSDLFCFSEEDAARPRFAVLPVGDGIANGHVHPARLRNQGRVLVLPITRPSRDRTTSIEHVTRDGYHMIIFPPIRPFNLYKQFVRRLFTVRYACGMLYNVPSRQPTQVSITSGRPALFLHTFREGFRRIEAFPRSAIHSLLHSRATLVLPLFRILQEVGVRLLATNRGRRPVLTKYVPRRFQITRIALYKDGCQVIFMFNGNRSIIHTMYRTLHLAVAPKYQLNEDMRDRRYSFTRSYHVILICRHQTTRCKTPYVKRGEHSFRLPIRGINAHKISPHRIPPDEAM